MGGNTKDIALYMATRCVGWNPLSFLCPFRGRNEIFHLIIASNTKQVLQAGVIKVLSLLFMSNGCNRHSTLVINDCARPQFHSLTTLGAGSKWNWSRLEVRPLFGPVNVDHALDFSGYNFGADIKCLVLL
jgi:hypothetical protein